MTLKIKDILQINATIVAGAFILLSIVTIGASNTSIFYTKLTAITVASEIIIIFCWSCIQALKVSIISNDNHEEWILCDNVFAFVFLALTIVTFVRDIPSMIPILTNITKSYARS